MLTNILKIVKNISSTSKYMYSLFVNNAKLAIISYLQLCSCCKQYFVKVKCPNCYVSTQILRAHYFVSFPFQSYSVETQATPLLYMNIKDITGVACAVTGASSTTWERLYNLLRDQGNLLEETRIRVTLVDGLKKTMFFKQQTLLKQKYN